MSEQGPASVEFRSVVKCYGSATAVNNVSFTVAAGTLVTLLGPSGCGKTTTLRLIAGLEIATGGKILIGGQDVTHLSAVDRDVSMVFQSYALFPHMTVLDNVAYGPTVSGIARPRAREMAAEKLAMIGLSGFEARLPSELSGGQQQRVAVARALVLEPKVLLFDEPLSNLDAKLRRRVRQEIRELQRKLNLTVVYVTHDQQEALAVSDRIIVMSNAAIAQEGTPRELYEAPVDIFVADFIGDANVIDAELVATQDGLASIRVAGVELQLPHRGIRPGPVKLSIRPESLRLSGDRPQGPAIAGKITKFAYLGTHVEYNVTCPSGELLIVDHSSAPPVPAGTDIWMTLGEHGVTLVPG